MTVTGDEGHLFAWRARVGLSYTLWRPFHEVPGVQGVHRLTTLICPYCTARFAYDFNDCPFTYSNVRGWERMPVECTRTCVRCGFSITEAAKPNFGTGFVHVAGSMSLLRRFHVTDPEVTTEELVVHLRRRKSDVHFLTSRRFEELVAQIYGNLGYSVRLTQQTKDQGRDLVLLEAATGEQVLVEIKLLGPSKKLSVTEVRTLAGVLLIQQVNRGVLVMSTEPSVYAVKEATLLNAGPSPHSVELTNLSDLLRQVGVLQNPLVPAHALPSPAAAGASVCVFCRRLPAVQTHPVPGRFLVRTATAECPLAVPACATCGGLASLDDDYFAAKVLARSDLFGNQDVVELWKRVLRAFEEPSMQSFAKQMQSEFTLPDEYGAAVAYTVEFDRIRAVLHRTCQGLDHEHGLGFELADEQLRLFEGGATSDVLAAPLLEAVSQGIKGGVGERLLEYRIAEHGTKLIFELEFFGRVSFLLVYGANQADLPIGSA